MQGNLSSGFQACSAHMSYACVFILSVWGKRAMVSANFLCTEKMCCWTDGKLRKVKQTKGQQIHGPFFFSHPSQPNFATQKPARQNYSGYVLLFCFHDWNFQHGSAAAIERNKLYHTEWPPQDRVSLSGWADHHTAELVWRKHTAKFLQIWENGSVLLWWTGLERMPEDKKQ